MFCRNLDKDVFQYNKRGFTMNQRNRKRRDSLRSRVVRFEIPHDLEGNFIPYCEHLQHRGIVMRLYVCEQRQCKHLRKHYLDGVGRVDEPMEENCHDNNY